MKKVSAFYASSRKMGRRSNILAGSSSTEGLIARGERHIFLHLSFLNACLPLIRLTPHA